MTRTSDVGANAESGMSLPSNVIREDKRLSDVVARSREDLARHRWHWTLDESNPGRVSIRQYARAVARAESGIRRYVNAYEMWLSLPDAQRALRTLSDCLERAQISDERLAAVEAVAKAKGVSERHAREHLASAVSSVVRSTRERVERATGLTTFADEVSEVAEWHERARRSREWRAGQRKACHTGHYIRMEGLIGAVCRYLVESLNVARDVEFSDDERELLADSIDKARGLLDLVRSCVAGDSRVDWDAELAKLARNEDE